jgi:hypothetical protein
MNLDLSDEQSAAPLSELDRIIDNELPVLAPDPRAQRAPAEEAIRPCSRSAADLIPAAIRPLLVPHSSID